METENNEELRKSPGVLSSVIIDGIRLCVQDGPTLDFLEYLEPKPIPPSAPKVE
jgi:hypothetical protein